MSLQVGLDGLFARGVPAAALEALWPKVEAARAALAERSARDVGFLRAPADLDVQKSMAKEVKRLTALADDLLVLGIGGSSLGGKTLVASLGRAAAAKVHFADNIDPDGLNDLLDALEPERTAALVITKSGGTTETLAQFLIVRRWFFVRMGAGEARPRIVFVTDPAEGFLRSLVPTEGVRSFEVPPNVGGRYSALTPVGLLPAGFAGMDVGALCGAAAAAGERVIAEPVRDNPACQIAAAAYLAWESMGASSIVCMPYADRLGVMAHWFVQLWGESLGKLRGGERVGQTPIPALGATDQHSQLQLFLQGPQDKVLLLIGLETFSQRLPIPGDLGDHPEVAFLGGKDLSEVLRAEAAATRKALVGADVPVIDVTLPALNPATLGELLMVLEAACPLVGFLMGIEPFDQPGVEAIKRETFRLLGRDT